MPRLFAEADATRWVPVTESFGLRGRRHRKQAIRMLMAQVNRSMGIEERGGGRFTAWAMSQAAPMLMRKAAGRVLVWVWKDDPELIVAMATLQEATPQVRAARAMRPVEYDDTESFPHPTFGVGERLIMDDPFVSPGLAQDKPGGNQPPFVSYSFDLGTHLVEVTAIAGDASRFRTVLGDLDALARELRVVDDLTVGESAGVLRLPPS